MMREITIIATEGVCYPGWHADQAGPVDIRTIRIARCEEDPMYNGIGGKSRNQEGISGGGLAHIRPVCWDDKRGICAIGCCGPHDPVTKM